MNSPRVRSGIIYLLLLVALFTIQNAAAVTVTFLFWKFSVSRSLLIFMVLAVGILTGWILGGVHRRRERKSRAPTPANDIG